MTHLRNTMTVALAGAVALAAPAGARTAAAGADFSAARTIEVSLANFEFAPATITLSVGQPYALRLVNRAKKGHDFSAPEFFAAAQVAREDAGKVAEGEIELRGGEAATVRLIPTAGSYTLTCTHFGHALLGMKGTILVR